jgi:DNA-binding response OmpR family regulator
MGDPKNNIYTVEIAEDDQGLAGLLADRLITEGYTVIKAPDGEEAYKLALERHPDIIVLDMMMPKMNGLEVIKKLRTDEWGSTAQIMLLTNDPDTNKVEQAIMRGVFDYLVKTDFKLDEIVEKIQQRIKDVAAEKKAL